MNKLPDQDILAKADEAKNDFAETIRRYNPDPLGVTEKTDEAIDLLQKQNEELRIANEASRLSARRNHHLNIFMAIMAALSFCATIISIILMSI